MRRMILLGVALLFVFVTFAQEVKTEPVTDWNTLRKSGFYESRSSNILNAPTNRDWLWGINIGHSTNSSSSVANVAYFYGAQILFPIINSSTAFPEMFIRSTNKNGDGMWAKVLHSKGDHAIDGKFTAKEIEIKLVTGADFVFEPDYTLKPLSEVESFVKDNKHLPDIPSEKEMKENGLNINDMQIKLLQKIEELTLYVIDLKKENESIKQELKELKKE